MADEIVGDGQAVGKIARLRVADIIFHIRFHLPFVGGMRFAHVDSKKIGMVFVVFEDLHDVANLATERWSSKAAENENQRFSAGPFANVKSFTAAERKKLGVGSAVAGL